MGGSASSRTGMADGYTVVAKTIKYVLFNEEWIKEGDPKK